MAYAAPAARRGGPGRAEIARAIPRGSRRARSQAEALRALAVDEELAGLRADRARNIREAWRILVRHASWADRTTRPTRARLCAQAGICESTWKACRRWLERRGYLGTVVYGTTAYMHGPLALANLEARNDAAVYILAIPLRKAPIRAPATTATLLTRPPTDVRRTSVQSPARAESQEQGGPASGRTHPLPPAALSLRKGPGESLTDGWVAYLARPFLAAGWSGADLSWAVDHDPELGQHRFTLRTVRHPAAWLRWRLSRWLGEDGAPRPAPSAIRADAAGRIRAAAQQRRAQQAAAVAAASPDVRGRAAEIRQHMGWRKPPERKPL